MYTLSDYMRKRGATYVTTIMVDSNKFIALTKLPKEDPRRFTSDDPMIMIPVDEAAKNAPLDQVFIILDNGGDETCVGELKAIINQENKVENSNYKINENDNMSSKPVVVDNSRKNTATKNVKLSLEEAFFVADELDRAYFDYNLNLNNEIANLITKINLNNKSWGVFGSVGEFFYRNNRETIKKLSRNITRRDNIIEAYSKIFKAYQTAGGTMNYPSNKFREDDENIKQLLYELCDLLKIEYEQLWY